MVRRSSLAVASILALIAVALAAAPVAAYNNVTHHHLRLTRLNPLVCGTLIRLLPVGPVSLGALILLTAY
jgi:hypothetical protein